MNEDNIKEIGFFVQSGNKEIVISDDIKFFLHTLLSQSYNKESYLLNYIFVSPEDITELNRQFLNHDYPTDVITFDFSDDFGVFGGDIFICPDVVFENAADFESEVMDELIRVMCHGLLHLLGYNDKADQERLEMLEQEEYCLAMFRTK